MKNIRGNSFYFSNQGELVEDAFAALPIGCVEAEGWLKNQLIFQKQGLTGAMETYPDYSPDSAWLGGNGEDWERGPYYVRGLVSLAYVLKDEELKNKAQKWIDWSINSQNEEGFFGPTTNTDWWPRMPMLMAIRDYYEATEREGKPDERVIPFMIRYFKYQLNKLPDNPLMDWAAARGGDNIDSVYWLYNRLYDENKPEDSKWLLDLAALLKSQTLDWTNIFNNTTVRHHVVNTSQALKMPVLFYQQSKSEDDKKAFLKGLFNMGIDHGRIDGLPNSDEAARDNKSTRGTETCGVVESMLSTEIAIRIFGDSVYADYLEKVAYNALPPCYAPDYLGHVYYILQNQVLATNGYHEFDCDHGDSSAFGAPNGFDCCFSNNHMGWPKLVKSMWMATKDNGLAVIAYGPNKVSAKVADGKNAVFHQVTNYPFDESVVLDYMGEEADFSLMLRIPNWCENPVVRINGEELNGLVAGKYFSLTRMWKPGDKVELMFPMKIEASTWYNDSVAVSRGPLIYSLKIKEDYRLLDNNDARELKVGVNGGLLNREVFPESRWNYGLVVDYDNPESSFTVVKNDMSEHPFHYENAPIILKGKGQIIPHWNLDGNIAGSQPFGSVPHDESLCEDIELVPYGSARLKITHFPKVGVNSVNVVRSDIRCTEEEGVKIQEFRNVVVPPASEYLLKVNYKGRGKLHFVLNGRAVCEVDFSASGSVHIADLKSLISEDSFRFDYGHYNNIRFAGNDNVEIQSIEIIPEGIIDAPVIESIKAEGSSIKIKTNINRDFDPYKILYGTKSGNYSFTASGFKTNEAVLTGLKTGETYYIKLVAFINGAQVYSEEKAICLDDMDVDNGVNVDDSLQQNENGGNFNMSADSAYELIQIKYPKIDGATSYKISYGKEKGVYTNYIYDIIFNPYKGSHPFTADKISFTVENAATYYVKMTALKDNKEFLVSDEIEVKVDSYDIFV